MISIDKDRNIPKGIICPFVDVNTSAFLLCRFSHLDNFICKCRAAGRGKHRDDMSGANGKSLRRLQHEALVNDIIEREAHICQTI